MVDTLKELLHSSLSERSRKQYSRAWVVFSEFYTRYQSADLHFPVSTACIALFISFLCAKGLAPATITSYLSAIAYVQKIKGYLDPTKSFLIEKLLVALGRRGQADVRMPISHPLLYELVSALQHTSPSAYRRSLFGAMFMTAFYGFFRIGELSCASKKQVDTILQFDHVTFLKQSSRVTAVKIVITKFKHNTNNRPFVITIESEPSDTFCPVQTLLDYIKLRGHQKGPLFACADGEAISTNDFNLELRRALTFCGLDCSRYKSNTVSSSNEVLSSFVIYAQMKHNSSENTVLFVGFRNDKLVLIDTHLHGQEGAIIILGELCNIDSFLCAVQKYLGLHNDTFGNLVHIAF